MTNLIVLLQLISAHLVADFVLQPQRVVNKKRAGNQWCQIGHAGLHALLAYLFVGNWYFWPLPLSIFVSHYVIDLWKALQKDTTRAFIFDQLTHLLIIIVLWLFVTKEWCSFEISFTTMIADPVIWIYLSGFLFIWKPTSIILDLCFSKWKDDKQESHAGAREWIGYLERTLILIFMCLHIYEAIGFLLAAKSIYRFGELKDGSEIKQTEYIMAGTFFSFTVAITVSLVIQLLVSQAGG